MVVVGVLIYAFLWALYASGDSVLLAPLLIPAVLAVMVALGVGLQRFMASNRATALRRRSDETEQ